VDTGVDPIAPAVDALARPARTAIFPLRIPAGPWLRLVASLWLLFCLLHFGRVVWSFLYLRGVKRCSLPPPEAVSRTFQSWVAVCRIERPARILISNRIASPLATGFWRPAVILPERLLGQFKERELDHVILHELAHVARCDDWSNLAARMLTAVVGLNPVAAWVLRQVARERELACDDWVVSMTGEARPYAASLARLFELCGTRYRTVLAAGMAGSASHLGERIEILLGRGRQFTPRPSLMRIACTVTALLLFVAVGSRAPRWIVLAQSPSAPAAGFRGPVPVANPRASFLAALVAAGYGDLSVDQIIALKEHGITAAFLTGISQSGWERMTTDDLIELQSHGVSPGYLRAALLSGFKQPSIRDVISLRQHGIRPEQIGEIHAMGFGPYTPGEAIDLTTHGVGPDTFRSAQQYGSHFTVQQIVKLKEAGVIR
jgi:beta-lactamase regulating signal transducer with metallopeptidase domain